MTCRVLNHIFRIVGKDLDQVYIFCDGRSCKLPCWSWKNKSYANELVQNILVSYMLQDISPISPQKLIKFIKNQFLTVSCFAKINNFMLILPNLGWGEVHGSHIFNAELLYIESLLMMFQEVLCFICVCSDELLVVWVFLFRKLWDLRIHLSILV